MKNISIGSFLRRSFNFTSLVIGLCLISSTGLNAAHIVGGDATYSCVFIDSMAQQTTFLLEFTIYRDSEAQQAAPFDDPADFGIYRQLMDGSWEYIDDFSQDLEDQADIVVEENPCVETPPNVGVEKAVYRFTYVFDWSAYNYMVAYQRCCRNNTIANIFTPGETGAAYLIEITPEAQTSCNNSPRFEEFPPIFICNGIDVNFNHAATDADGDEIRYSFCTPISAGGTGGGGGGGCNVPTPNPRNCLPPFDIAQFRPPFYEGQPLGGNPIVTINSLTGLISGTPVINGQFVVAICATEYRDGEIISVIQRDFQFNVTTCQSLIFADIISSMAMGNQEYIINSCGITTVDMINLSQEESNIVSYKWEFDTTGDGLFDATRGTRDASFDFEGVNTYSGRMILNENSPQCSDTAFITVNLYPSIEAEFEFEYDTCGAGPVQFFDESFTGGDRIEEWDWDFNGENEDFKQNPFHKFNQPGEKLITLIATDSNECKDTIEKIIDYFPAPPIIIIEPNSFKGCVPADIKFNNLSSVIDSTYMIDWTFGDGGTGNDISPSHTYNEPGVFSVTVDVTSPIGCKKSITYPNWIVIEPEPIANFECDRMEADLFNNTINFNSTSTGADKFQWNFANIGTSLEENPSFTFVDTGLFEIKLTIIHESGCPDTVSKFIDILPFSSFFLPTGFTPNNDGKNDFFLGKGFVEGIKDFELVIWNRWGEKVFFTDDPREAWNGFQNNNGPACPQGIYPYTFRMIGPRGEVNEKQGSVTLIR